KKFMGVDIGLNYIAVASTTDLECTFFDGGIIKHIRHMFVGMRERLQRKGSRSAKRMLKRLAGREKRLINNICHVASKRVVEFALEKGVDVIGLEDLNGIRKRTKVRKKQRYDFESWVYRKLQFIIEYKAKQRGIAVVYVDPKHTSITCPRCYHVNKANRNGKLFRCKACGYTLNADLVGARNIERRTREFRYMRDSLGCCQPPRRPFEGQAPSVRVG
ncbi:MAG: Transposase, IS605 OrfB family, partial [Methanosarcinales archeaon 56_1174]